MSERYFITGVQIGIMKTLLERVTKMNATNLRARDVIKIDKILKEIEDKQFVGKITQEGEKVIIAK